MAEKDTRLPQISVTRLGGINLRKGRNQLDAGECDRNFGLYPSQTGLLSRVPGKTLWRVFEDGDTPRDVLQVQQTFDGSGNIIIQNGDAIGLYTLDELRNRVASYSLTPTPAPAGIGNYVLMAHIESNGTNGGQVGSSSNVFYPGTVNTLISDEGGVVQSINGTSFTLPLGTYRINATILYGLGSATFPKCRAGLYSLTAGAFKKNIGTDYEIISTSGVGRFVSTGGFEFNTPMFVMGRFEVTAASEVLAIYMATSSDSTNTNRQGSAASRITSKNEIYKLITIIQE